MNVHFQRFFGLFAVCLLLTVPVCAAGSAEPPLDETESPAVAAPAPVVVQGSSAADIVEALVSAVGELSYQGELDSIRAFYVPMDDPDSGISPAYDLDNGQTSEPSGTLKSILVKLIGPYNPVVVEYRYQNYNASTYSYLREIQPDYVWWFSAGLFGLLVFCTFRLGGALLRKI